MGWELSWRVSGRAAAESQPWVPYESALAGAPGTGGWGEQFPHAGPKESSSRGTGASPIALPSVLGWGAYSEDSGIGETNHWAGLPKCSLLI